MARWLVVTYDLQFFMSVKSNYRKMKTEMDVHHETLQWVTGVPKVHYHVLLQLLKDF